MNPSDLLNGLPNLLPLAEEVQEAASQEAVHGAGWYIFVVIGLVIAGVLFLLSLAKQGYGDRIFKNAWSQRAEQLYLFLEQFAVGIIGVHGRKYLPVLSTFWLVIFFSNFIGLFIPYAPTADLSINLGMALVAVGYVQYEGMKTNGVLGHFRHFAGPKLGGGLVIVSAMIFVIEIVSEAMKNVSLSLRLYGNIDGGHKAVETINGLVHIPGLGPETMGLPLGGLLLPIKLLTCLVQAMVFVLLLCV
ncbi:F0F1 ATP synthase subunit A, partial [bacterium]